MPRPCRETVKSESLEHKHRGRDCRVCNGTRAHWQLAMKSMSSTAVETRDESSFDLFQETASRFPRGPHFSSDDSLDGFAWIVVGVISGSDGGGLSAVPRT